MRVEIQNPHEMYCDISSTIRDQDVYRSLMQIEPIVMGFSLRICNDSGTTSTAGPQTAVARSADRVTADHIDGRTAGGGVAYRAATAIPIQRQVSDILYSLQSVPLVPSFLSCQIESHIANAASGDGDTRLITVGPFGDGTCHSFDMPFRLREKHIPYQNISAFLALLLCFRAGVSAPSPMYRCGDFLCIVL